MSLFGTIMSKILGHPVAAPAAASDTPATPAPAPAATPEAPAAAAPAAAAPAAAAPAAASGPPVDVDAVLTGMAKSGQPLNWKQSIVDLMKLLDLDSSLTARKQLATELHYTGNQDDSASMNVWLHQQIMQKLAENGGKLPAGL